MKTLFVGDICPTIHSAEYFANADTKALFADAVSLFEECDFSFANIECAITESKNKIKKFGPNLKAPYGLAKVLAELGVTVAGLSNNHVFDFGKEGAIDTIKALTAEGIASTGFGDNYEDSRKNYTYEKDGERICVIAVCEHEYSYALEDRMGSRPFDEFDTIEDITQAKRTHDRVIVIYHGGKEYCRYPSPRLVRVCRAMIRNGADLVICQHSHCIGTYELYEGGHIVYGQGNFHFVALKNTEGWRTGLAIRYDTESNEIEFIPVSETEVGIRLVMGKDRDELLEAFTNRSATMTTGEWKKEWHDYCVSVQEIYKGNITRAFVEDSTERENAIFGHYLECEAHNDVWRELFPTYNSTNEKE